MSGSASPRREFVLKLAVGEGGSLADIWERASLAGGIAIAKLSGGAEAFKGQQRHLCVWIRASKRRIDEEVPKEIGDGGEAWGPDYPPSS